MNSIAILILVIGIIFLIVGYNKTTNNCPPPRIQYRFLPRAFYDEQINPINLENLFGSMFKGQDSWLNRNQNNSEDSSIKTEWSNYFDVPDDK